MLRPALATAAALALLAALPARAEWNEKDVKAVQEAVKQGKPVIEYGSAPGAQLVFFSVGSGWQIVEYVIDLRAQLCFARGVWASGGPQSTSPVPCAAVKKGYPLFAPLITWEP